MVVEELHVLAESFPLGVLVVTTGAYSNVNIWSDFIWDHSVFHRRILELPALRVCLHLGSLGAGEGKGMTLAFSVSICS